MLILLLIVSGSLFADVQIESADAVTIIFTYEDDSASSVNIAGDFQGWNAESDPMEKNEEGIWTYTMEAQRGETILYKFVVDGEWITDPGAPDTVDDGFGGKNGRLVVDAVIAMQAGDEEAAAAAAASGGLNFSTTFKVRSDNKFLTRDLAVGDVSGYEFNSSNLVTDSYWNIAGSVANNTELNLELKALSGSTTLYEANALGTRIPYTTFTDGLQRLASIPFSPVTSLNGAIPSVNKFTLTYSGDYLGLKTVAATAKNTSNSVIYDVVKANDANDGLLEITNGEMLSQLGPVSLDAMIGLTAQRGGYGLFNWVTVGLMDLMDITVNYNVHSPSTELFRFNEDFGNAAAIGISATPLDILTLKGQYLLSFGPNDTLDGDAMAGALQANLDLDGAYTAGLTLKYGGDNAYTIFGDDGHLKQGNFYVELNQSTQPIDMFKAGVDFNVGMDNFDSIDTEALNMYFKPYADLFLANVLPLDLTAKMYGKLNVDKVAEATDADQPTASKFTEAGLEVAWKGISEFLKSITLDYGLSFGHGDFDAAEDEYPLDWVYNTVAARVGLDKGLSANVAAVIRSRGDSEDAVDSDVPFGFGIGTSLATEWEKLNTPTLDLNYTWNADPFDGGSSSLKFSDDHVFRLDNLTGGAGESMLRFGVIWSF